MTGCGRSVGAYVRQKLIDQGHAVTGVGLDGPDVKMDFLQADHIDIASLFRNTSYDVLINNAGITRIDFIRQHRLSDFNDVLRVNLSVPFAFCQQFIRRAQEYDNEKPSLRRYRIINTSSMATSVALRASPGYCASKAGLEALTRVLAKELAGKLPITCVCIAPGGIEDTAMIRQATEDLQRTRGMTAEQAEAYARQSPMGRHCTMDEVWRMFDFAVNYMPEYCSGEVFRMMGGMGVMS